MKINENEIVYQPIIIYIIIKYKARKGGENCRKSTILRKANVTTFNICLHHAVLNFLLIKESLKLHQNDAGYVMVRERKTRNKRNILL